VKITCDPEVEVLHTLKGYSYIGIFSSLEVIRYESEDI